MIKLHKDEDKFKNAILTHVTNLWKEIMMKTEWYSPKKVIVLWKSKNHEEDEFFSIPFSVKAEWDTEKLANKHYSGIFNTIKSNFTLRNSKITEIIFELEKDKNLFAIRTDWGKFEIEESDGKYSY